MSTDSDRDVSVDRMLQAELRRADAGGMPPATPACVDAEMLAAWSEGVLPAEDAQRVEAHMADCTRCQSMMAVFARAEPVAASVVPFRRPWSARWVVPLVAGTLAASLLVWIAWPSAPKIAAPEQTMARSEGRGAEPPLPAGPTSLVAAPAAAAPVQAPTMADRADAVKPQAMSPKPQPAPGPKAEQKAAQNGVRTAARVTAPPNMTVTGEFIQSLPRGQAAAAPPPSTAGAVAGAAAAANARTSTIAGLPQNTVDTTPVFRSNAGPETVVAEFSAVDLPTSSTTVATLAQGAAGGGGGGGGRGGGGRGGGARGGGGRAGAAAVATGRATVTGEAVEPATPLRWRVLASGTVERSSNAGVVWEPVKIDVPDVKITSGVAPMPLVCWLGGRGGVVLRSIDGVEFSRITFPEAADIASITATSALNATVTTAQGHVFVTADGGVTWR